MKFELSDADVAKIDAWAKEIDKEVVAAQRKEMADETCGVAEFCWEQGFPYAGAIGGAMSYTFCPTSIGMCITIRYYGRELDLSDF